MDFDASEWQALAKTDPQEFERRRVALIEELIASAPPDIQRRLRGTQFRVDMERGRASNPLSATLRISRMMWESFADLREQLNHLAAGDSDSGAGAAQDTKSVDSPNPSKATRSTTATILPLRRPAVD